MAQSQLPGKLLAEGFKVFWQQFVNVPVRHTVPWMVLITWCRPVRLPYITFASVYCMFNLDVLQVFSCFYAGVCLKHQILSDTNLTENITSVWKTILWLNAN